MILIFPGFWTEPADYQIITEPLTSRGKNVEVVDLFSPQSHWPAPCPWAEWEEKLVRKIKSMPLQPTQILGYSLGARLVLNLRITGALNTPSILLSVHPGLIPESERQVRLKSDRAWAEKFRILPWPELHKLWNNQAVFQETKLLEKRYHNFDREKLAASLEHFSLGLQADQRMELNKLPLKTCTWVVGEKDEKFVKLTDDLKTISLIRVPSAGHRVLWDQPQRILEMLE